MRTWTFAHAIVLTAIRTLGWTPVNMNEYDLYCVTSLCNHPLGLRLIAWAAVEAFLATSIDFTVAAVATRVRTRSIILALAARHYVYVRGERERENGRANNNLVKN